MNIETQKLSPEEKRLDVVVKFFYPVVAGIETNILNIYSYLAKQGWEVVIHTSTSIPNSSEILPLKGEIQGLSIQRYKWRWAFAGAVPRGAGRAVPGFQCLAVSRAALVGFWCDHQTQPIFVDQTRPVQTLDRDAGVSQRCAGPVCRTHGRPDRTDRRGGVPQARPASGGGATGSWPAAQPDAPDFGR